MRKFTIQLQYADRQWASFHVEHDKTPTNDEVQQFLVNVLGDNIGYYLPHTAIMHEQEAPLLFKTFL